MAYTVTNYPSKKALKEAVASGIPVPVCSAGPFPAKTDGTEYVEGPHYPEPHRWYAQVELVNGLIVKVK